MTEEKMGCQDIVKFNCDSDNQIGRIEKDGVIWFQINQPKLDNNWRTVQIVSPITVNCCEGFELKF
jgi:hypothetical protein